MAYDDTADETKASSLRTFVQSHVVSGAFPPPTTDTVYVLFFPSTTTLTLDALTSCKATGGFYGYHGWTTVTAADGGAPLRVQYAALADCGEGSQITTWISHEIAEAATDPQPNTHPTYGIADPAWLLAYTGNVEVADVCVGANTTEESWQVQRIWSNATALAGHSACAPVPSGATFFNAAPASQVVELSVGESTTIDVTGYADAPMAAWPLTVEDWSAHQGKSPYLALSLDDASMYAGKTVRLTITLLAAPPVDPYAQGPYAAYHLYSHGTSGTPNQWLASVKMK
jgi:hypothetical protein